MVFSNAVFSMEVIGDENRAPVQTVVSRKQKRMDECYRAVAVAVDVSAENLQSKAKRRCVKAKPFSAQSDFALRDVLSDVTNTLGVVSAEFSEEDDAEPRSRSRSAAVGSYDEMLEMLSALDVK